MKLKAVGAVAMMSVGLLGVSTMAHALTTEDRIVSEFSGWDGGDWVERDTGWENHSTTGTRAEIGSAYGAPTGHGREAVMLDNPTYGSIAEVIARVGQQDQTGLPDAFPGILADSDLQLGFWVYIPAGSSSSLEVRTSLVMDDESWWFLWFPLSANDSNVRDEWRYIEITADDAAWRLNHPSVAGTTEMTWSQVITDAAASNGGNPPSLGNVSFTQWEGDFSAAIDGVTVSDGDTWSTVVDFELAPTSGRPILDDCKNDGWQTHFAGPFKNQGACIAAIVAAN